MYRTTNVRASVRMCALMCAGAGACAHKEMRVSCKFFVVKFSPLIGINLI
jgi:hypothetical protein